MFHCIAGANDHITRVSTSIFSLKELPDISLPGKWYTLPVSKNCTLKIVSDLILPGPLRS